MTACTKSDGEYCEIMGMYTKEDQEVTTILNTNYEQSTQTQQWSILGSMVVS